MANVKLEFVDTIISKDNLNVKTRSMARQCEAKDFEDNN